MARSFVRIACDIYCREDDIWYRLFIDDEILTERSVPDDQGKYVQEIATLKAVPGRYMLWCRSNKRSRIDLKNVRVLEGAAKVESGQYITIE